MKLPYKIVQLFIFALFAVWLTVNFGSSQQLVAESDFGEIGWEEDSEQATELDLITPISRGKVVTPPVRLPTPAREFRAAWVATVHNLDWPSKPGLSQVQLEGEAIAILDRLVDLNMNAVIFQVRPDGDAFYRSELEPWSYYLTGKQGHNPSGFDPLAFWIDQAHSRGIQLHAWFNPYRVYHHPGNGPISSQSIIKSSPELVVKLRKQGYWWMDPGLAEARAHTLKVVMDVVSRYDIDGVHFDDYFYPYPAYNGNRRFPDSGSYAKYQETGGNLGLKDWRRDSVNQLVSELSNQIKLTKSHVEFGISPFGIWRPGYPKGITGLDQYNVLYADARLWFRAGWVDYLMPQLYWPVGSRKQSFPKLLGWWHEQNFEKRHLWPGMRITSGTELLKQIKVTREQGGDDVGMCLFSMKGLMRTSRDTAKTLKSSAWTETALIPSSPWLNDQKPAPPIAVLAREESGSLIVHFESAREAPFQILINDRRQGEWLPALLVPGDVSCHLVDPEVDAVAIRFVGRCRNVSDPVMVNVPQSVTSR